MTIAEVRVPIMLDRERTMVFDMNTMEAYERASGHFYFDTLLMLFDVHATVMAENKEALERDPKTQPPSTLLGIARRIPMGRLRDLVWAATHDYPDERDDPVWPLTRNQVGRLLPAMKAPQALNLILKGHVSNSPTKNELGEAQAAPRQTAPEKRETKEAAPGGTPSIELLADAFA